MERTIRRVVLAGVAVVVLGGAWMFWTAEARLLADTDMTGEPCPTLTHGDVLRLGLRFPEISTMDRQRINGILVGTIDTRKRCAQTGRHASCGLDGAGYTRVFADETLQYFALGEGQAALLDIVGTRVRCVLTTPKDVAERFS